VLQVELVYTSERFPRIGKKSSSSANKWIDRRQHSSLAECYRVLHSEGFMIVATRVGSGSRLLYDLDLTRKTAFVLGNEHRGVSEEAAEGADASVHIPMLGMIESLNVSVAAAVCLYETLRQRLAKGILDQPQLTPDVLESLYSSWTER
jgi:tRNA (guanosine-2'-O-)-methyltransferase